MMKGILRHRPRPATAIALTALVVALGGVAYATIPDSTGTIHGCYQRGNGNLRVVESSGDCRSSEQAIQWNQQGPRGATQTLQRTTLHDGETGVLLSQGPIRLDARCQMDQPVGDTETKRDSAEVLVSTTEEHTGISGEAVDGPFLVEVGPSSGPHALRQVLSFHLGLGTNRANYNTKAISISTPSGIDISAQLYVGVNTFGQSRTCSFGGYVVSS